MSSYYRPDDRAQEDVTVLLRRRTTVRFLFLVIVALMVLSSAGQVAKYGFGHSTVLGLVEFTYVEEENNLPTWYGSVQILFCSGLLAIIAIGKRRSGDRWAMHWLWLSVIFAAMSLDEAGTVHERMINPLWRLLGTLPGPWQPLWVIPVLVVVAIVGMVYLRFVLSFSWRYRLQIICAAGLFVGGAVGLEMLTATQFDPTDPLYKEQVRYVVFAHVEEFMEMTGVLIFLDFLLAYLARSGIRCRFGTIA